MSKIFWANSYIYRSNREKTGKEGYKSMQSTVLHSPASMSRRSSSWHRFFPRIDAIMNLKWFDRLSDNKLSRSLVVSYLRSETNGSRFESGCYLWAGGSGCEELKKCPPPSPAVLWFVNGRKRKPRQKKKIFLSFDCIFCFIACFFLLKSDDDWTSTHSSSLRFFYIIWQRKVEEVKASISKTKCITKGKLEI